MSEKRRAARHRALKGGSIAFSGGARIDCVIRNLSETGAALQVESPLGIPNEFTLFVNQKRQNGPAMLPGALPTKSEFAS